jgi:hypothetical protein
MNRLVFGALAAALLCVAGGASAQTTVPPPVSFATVDAVKVEYSRISITGIVEDEASPRTLTFYFSTSSTAYSLQQACERLGLLAMAKPGQYVLEVQQVSSLSVKCTLARAAP